MAKAAKQLKWEMQAERGERISGRVWMRLRAAVIERDTLANGGICTCEYCGNNVAADPTMRVQVDHIIPIEQGGAVVDLDNLITSCHRCNGSAGHWFGRKPAHIEQAVLLVAFARNRA